ncbi:MAG: SH3 domain-containing protein [Lachnospiraceae bacterium]|nr:SH3 domain-containing protein [Lachnospiraceae bacterium]
MKKLSVVKGLAGLALMGAVFLGTAFPSLAAEGKVTAETAKIRANTSTDSEVVGSTVRGKTIDILEAVKDSSGTVWYKVAVTNGGYGYIRSDLVETSEKIEVSASSSQTNAGSSQLTSQPTETVPTSIGEQQAVVNSGNNANVRSGASTQHSVVASLPSGTSMTLIGEATDGSGNKWYQLTCNYNGKTVEGYVRADLITIGAGGSQEQPASENPEGGGEGENPDPSQGENPEGTEGAAPEEGGEGQPAESEHNDYQVVYTANQAGEQDYYLYMPDGNMVKVTELLGAAESAKESIQNQQEQLEKEKIIIIILAGVIVLLFVVITVLLFKIRSLYYDDYEDEEEEDEEEEEEPEPAPVRRKVRRKVVEEEEEPKEAPVRKKRPLPAPEEQERVARQRERTGQPRAKEEKELHAAERREPERKPASRKPQNFLIDDDEFEFEFLNMDDKDL